MQFRIAAVVLLLTAPLAQSQARTSDGDVMTEVSNARMRSILQGMGFEFTEKATDDSYAFLFQLNGYQVILLNQAKDMQLYAGFTGKGDLTRVNEWNSRYRFGRGYVNDKGGASLEEDLDFAGGITKTAIEAFIKRFRTTLTSYVNSMTELSVKTSTPSPTPVSGVPLAVDRSTPPTGSTPSAQLLSYTRSPSAAKHISTSVGDIVLWVNEAKWKQEKVQTAGELQFSNVNGEAWARIITERIGIPTDGLREIALINAKSADPNAKITFEEKRIVNGRQILALQIAGTIKGVPFKYFGYYHGGTSGSIQAITYTVESAFANNLADFTEFLNGLEISDRDLPSSVTTPTVPVPGLLLFNSKVSLTYDPKKWKQTPSEEPGRFTFTHSSGDGYAMILAERIPVPMDSLPDIALSNIRAVDPSAKIILEEKRRVNGVEVWFLKIDAEVNKISLGYCGYYYGGKGGTVQALTYTGKSLFAEYESDFMEFLNGLRVSE